MLEIRVICEGPTDLEVIRAALRARTDEDFNLVQLQPDGSLYGGDAGPHGGGWKGVRGYLEAAAQAGGLQAVGALRPEIDLLIVHLDADVADEAEISCARPCPPALDTVDALDALLRSWMNGPDLDPRIAFCLPSKATESWIIQAVIPSRKPADVDPECHPDPAALLLGGPRKLVRRRGPKLKKLRPAYAALVPALTKAWPELAVVSTTAKRFDDQLGQILTG